MLFSNSKIANYINNNFEPVWVAVRPVPKVTVDFGNGRKVTRTVTGNIATYICTADGYTIDIIPGIYKPKVYFESIKKLHLLALRLMNSKEAVLLSLKSYHKQELNRQKHLETVNYSDPKYQFLSKDTENNESVRRFKVHKLLLDRNLVEPKSIYPLVYKEVLGLDLTDPYMGLYGMLKANYPFQDTVIH